jgi:ribosome modulation factor
VTPLRRKEVRRLHQEGYDARIAGKGIGSCPHAYRGNMDRYQWENGWRDADEQLRPPEPEEPANLHGSW